MQNTLASVYCSELCRSVFFCYLFNIFLLTICIGIVAVTGIPVNRADNFVLFELATVGISALCFVGIVFLGPSRIAGFALLAAYIVFLVLEFTVYKR